MLYSSPAPYFFSVCKRKYIFYFILQGPCCFTAPSLTPSPFSLESLWSSFSSMPVSFTRLSISSSLVSFSSSRLPDTCWSALLLTPLHSSPPLLSTPRLSSSRSDQLSLLFSSSLVSPLISLLSLALACHLLVIFYLWRSPHSRNSHSSVSPSFLSDDSRLFNLSHYNPSSKKKKASFSLS